MPRVSHRHHDRGIMREDGLPIAWVTDPARNILSVIEEAGPRGT